MTNNTYHFVAILFADMVGYTALMHDDEALALRKLDRFKKELEEKISTFKGQLIQYYGDGCLVAFSDCADSVKCAMTLQENFALSPEIPVRIGIHQGRVLFRDGNVYGSTVNVASRIESMSVPGAVLLSSTVYESMQNHRDLKFAPLGPFEYKNVKNPMEVFAVANEGFRVPEKKELKGKFKEKTAEVGKSIVVLPFANLSGQPEEEYFGDGITEEIIHAITNLRQLKVVGRTSSFAFKGKNLDLREIGQQLNVNTILEGSFRKAGNRFRITAQLINVADGFHLWSEKYDRRDVTDIFDIQDDIAKAIANKLKVTLLGDPGALMVAKTKNPEAYEMYLKGLYYFNNLKKLSQAETYFKKALELDPEYSSAWAGLGNTYFYMSGHGNSPADEVFPKAREAALKAIALDDKNAAGYDLLGAIQKVYDWDWKASKASLDRAYHFNPNLPELQRTLYFYNLFVENHERARHFAQKGIEIEPINPEMHYDLAYYYFTVGNYYKALEVIDDTLEMVPAYTHGHRLKAWVHLRLSNHELAVEAIRKAFELEESKGFSKVHLALILAQTGGALEAKKILSDILQSEGKAYFSPAGIAWIYSYLGDMESAYPWLDKSIAAKEGVWAGLKANPAFDRLRAEPRFAGYEKRINIPLKGE